MGHTSKEQRHRPRVGSVVSVRGKRGIVRKIFAQGKPQVAVYRVEINADFFGRYAAETVDLPRAEFTMHYWPEEIVGPDGNWTNA